METLFAGFPASEWEECDLGPDFDPVFILRGVETLMTDVDEGHVYTLRGGATDDELRAFILGMRAGQKLGEKVGRMKLADDLRGLLRAAEDVPPW